MSKWLMTFKAFHLFLVCSCLSAVSACADILNNHEAPNYTELAECKSALDAVERQASDSFDAYSVTANHSNNSSSLRLLSWNIEKGKNPGWKDDLVQLAASADLVLLQEAVLSPEMKTPNPNNTFWSFSKGYTTSNYTSGILIASRLAPDFTCTLQITEPWLRSPKSSLLTFFTRENVAPLVVVNLHAINFTIGVEEFGRQLTGLKHILLDHRGPLIVAGDFNTWNNSRLQLLDEFSKALALDEVTFSPDERTQKFGQVLDYIFVRQLTVASTKTREVTTSDHNPLSVVLQNEYLPGAADNLALE